MVSSTRDNDRTSHANEYSKLQICRIVYGKCYCTWLTAGATEAKSSSRSIFLLEKLLTPMHLHNPISRHFSIPAQVDSRSSSSKSSSFGTAWQAHGLNLTGQCTRYMSTYSMPRILNSNTETETTIRTRENVFNVTFSRSQLMPWNGMVSQILKFVMFYAKVFLVIIWSHSLHFYIAIYGMMSLNRAYIVNKLYN